MIDRGDIRQAIDRCSNIWASLPGAGYGQFEHKADSLIAKFKEAGGTVREIDVWAESPRYLRSGLSAIIVCLSRSNCHYRDNAITYKAQRDKNAREQKLANAAITDMQMRSGDDCLPMQNTRRVIDTKAENDALRDVRAIVVGCRIKRSVDPVREATTASGVDNAASPRPQTPLNRIISPSERGWSLCKNNWKEPEVY